MPLHRRLPKRGFVNIFREEVQVVNVGRLNVFAAGTSVDARALKGAGLISDASAKVKILGMGELKHKLAVTADSFSEKAKKVIEAAGGTAQERKS